MRVVLAAMPWQSLHRPSLPVGLLHSVVRRECPDVTVFEYHGGIDWAAHLLGASAGRLGPREYAEVAENGVVHGLGDWVFAGCLYDDPAWRAPELRDYAADRGVDIAGIEDMREYASDYLDKAVDHILAIEPDVVGLTSTFMQNVPSLALARRLKLLRPDLTVVMGGANCDGPMGHALHRNHRFLDFVVRGEGEPVFPALLNRLASGDEVADLPGLCWWAGDESMANQQATHGMPPDQIPSPGAEVIRGSRAAAARCRRRARRGAPDAAVRRPCRHAALPDMPVADPGLLGMTG